jgi:hypothetical protein
MSYSGVATASIIKGQTALFNISYSGIKLNGN